jgi:hypothetical protein
MSEKPSPDHICKAWQYYREADILFASRFNYSMVAQSMLLVSFATVLSATDVSTLQRHVAIAIAFFGLFFSAFPAYICSTLSMRMRAFRDHYLQHEPVYNSWLNMQDPYVTFATRDRVPIIIHGFLVPSVLLVLWIVLASFACC